MTSEEKARKQVDAQLAASGWSVQTKDKINLSAARGVAVCELSFATGEPDYTLFASGTLLISLPPLTEQTLTVAEMERRLSVVEELQSVVSANLQRTTRLCQSILQKAFAGELTKYD